MPSNRPLSVDITGVVELSFTSDALSPFMPGVPGRLNGQDVTARLDTGGSFVHLSGELAATLGIETFACETTFAALTRGKMSHATVDLDLGPVRLRNVPAAVHHGTLGTEKLADAFGVSLGPIIGTNVLHRFLTTVDAPGRVLLLSARGDANARAEHLARLPAERTIVPFAMWADHLMIARGAVGERRDLNFFVDSGLVAVHGEVQPATLVPARALRHWSADTTTKGPFVPLPGALALGSAPRPAGGRAEMTAMPLPDRTWREFGDWGGIRVDALISFGYLKHWVWTIDFDRYVYELAVRPRSGLAPMDR